MKRKLKSILQSCIVIAISTLTLCSVSAIELPKYSNVDDFTNWETNNGPIFYYEYVSKIADGVTPVDADFHLMEVIPTDPDNAWASGDIGAGNETDIIGAGNWGTGYAVDPVLRFVCPETGEITIKTDMLNFWNNYLSEGTDGARIMILKNDTKAWPENTQWFDITAEVNTAAVLTDINLSVEKGDKLRLVLDGKNNPWCDNGNWHMTFIYNSIESLPTVTVSATPQPTANVTNGIISESNSNNANENPTTGATSSFPIVILAICSIGMILYNVNRKNVIKKDLM